MAKSIISEGKTSTEAIEKGLEKLHVRKNMVDIEILESEEKRSFFSILEPRIVKVKLTLKENEQEEKKREPREIIPATPEDIEKCINNIEKFLKEFLTPKISENTSFDVKEEDNKVIVNIDGSDVGKLIGYRGDVLNTMQTLISAIGNKNTENKVKVCLDISGYRGRREQTLENLAQKVARTVSKTGKPFTLEPMTAYERKIIHTALQDSKYVTTYSVGEEPYRKVVISKK